MRKYKNGECRFVRKMAYRKFMGHFSDLEDAKGLVLKHAKATFNPPAIESIIKKKSETTKSQFDLKQLTDYHTNTGWFTRLII